LKEIYTTRMMHGQKNIKPKYCIIVTKVSVVSVQPTPSTKIPVKMEKCAWYCALFKL